MTIDRCLFSELLWDLIDHADGVTDEVLTAELEEAIRCIELGYARQVSVPPYEFTNGDTKTTHQGSSVHQSSGSNPG